MVTVTQHSITHTLAELLCALRYLRPVRAQLHRRRVSLEAQQAAGVDGDVEPRVRQVGADIALLDEMIRKMWESVVQALPGENLTAAAGSATVGKPAMDIGLEELEPKEPPE